MVIPAVVRMLVIILAFMNQMDSQVNVVVVVVLLIARAVSIAARIERFTVCLCLLIEGEFGD